MTRYNCDAPVPQIRLYQDWLARERGLRFEDYTELWQWSTTDLEAFWRSVWDYNKITSPTPVTSVLRDQIMPDVSWFEGAQVNYAYQVFHHADRAEAAEQPAIIADTENGDVRELGWRELKRQSASLALELRQQGVGRGDRVAAYLPNIPEAVIAFLACASLGAVWSLCSPDMGTPAVLDRFKQISPKALIATDGVYYGGKAMDRSATVNEMRAALPSVSALLVIQSGYGDGPVSTSTDFAAALSKPDEEVAAFRPEWVPFDHPLWILYSSGTTGLPKAIVHGHGGILLSSYAGHLHLDVGPSYASNTFGERFHWYSATGWVMWNQQVSGLLSGATICLYDGSPSGTKAHPDWRTMWAFAARHQITWFGAGAAFYIACRKADLTLAECGDLSKIRALGSTGSPLPPDVQLWGNEQFSATGRPDIWWCNISGGTDLFSGFMAGNPELPATPGKLQCRHLGAAVAAWDETGKPVVGAVGELVCTRPIPSMPLYFWGDEDGSRYRSSYFSEWPGIWRHGDWLRIDSDGSCSITGRSDATINRHGLRMGTADIYAAVEGLADVADSLVIDIEDHHGGSQLLMFVVPAEGRQLKSGLTSAMALAIRNSLSPRFVPDHFICAPGIPRTLSGKKQELPVKRLFQGWPARKVVNPDTIANPDVIPWYLERAQAWLRETTAHDTVEAQPRTGEQR
ncbi:acetoacetate--CoA ligase [Kordiimonas aestuarii]|uniref:acetoacetate--CoA ligase n=1 Tax=Kordiimonas aestuarii TaxID=1005925 RepID=UPI0021D0AEDA|nr:acetoacetate--CoA ligase [Kordiimonas aestuarii]